MSTNDDPVIITSEFLRDWRLPQPEGSKHSRGHVLVVGGAESTPGAAMLAGSAALRVGAGVLALAVDDAIAAPVAVALPEARVVGRSRLESSLAGTSYLLIGPGLDDAATAAEVLETVAAHADDESQFVLDAFALGVLPDSPVRARFAGRAVLTPNASEMARLLGDSDGSEIDGSDAAKRVASDYDAVVAFQGHVAAPNGRRWRVAAGHPGLGTSGSGDVLAGAVVGLLARGADAAQAASWATYLHAVAGERLAARVGRLGFLARELAAQLPIVLTETEA
jgi:ADP-dependent NAD(P)H-hydrate dehydratase